MTAVGRYVVVALGVVVAAPAAAEFRGTDLYRSCTEKYDLLAEAICTVYIRGVLDGLSLGDFNAGGGHSVYFCPPKDMGYTQARLIVEKYLRDHPEKLSEGADALVALALYQAFPCKR